MNLSNRMNRFSTVLMVLVAAAFATGCADIFVLRQVAASAKNDLNGMNTDWKTTEERESAGWDSENSRYTNTSFLVSDVHYAMASPAGGPTTTGETTAIAVKANSSFSVSNDPIQAYWNRRNPRPLKVLEFGAANTPTSTENLRAGGVGQNAWAVQLEQTRTDRDMAFRSFDSIKDAGNDSILGWGRWTDSRFINAGVVTPGCCSENKSAHYVFGAATPNGNIPNNGLVATFNFLAATAPTISDGSSAPGTLDTTSTVAVSFNGDTTNTRMGVNLTGTLNNLPFTVRSPGTTVTPTIPYDPVTRSFTMTNSSVDGSSISGFLAGPDATHVGLTYATPRQVGGPIFYIQGAAAFKR